MTPQQISEGTEVIKKFVGFTKCDRCENCGMLKLANDYILESSLVYHQDWGLLMTIVEKIEELGYNVYIEKQGCIIYDKNKISTISRTNNWPTKIEATFLAVVSFINWFNIKKNN